MPAHLLLPNRCRSSPRDWAILGLISLCAPTPTSCRARTMPRPKRSMPPSGSTLCPPQCSGSLRAAIFSFGSNPVAQGPKCRPRERGKPMTDLEPIPYSDQQIRRILETVKTIAMVGASSNWNRPSYFVMKYLQGKGYRVIPVNPGNAGQTLLGETVYASLKVIPDKIDMVDMFRAATEAPGVVGASVAIGAGIVWMQLGIRNDEACLLYTSPSPRDRQKSRMPSSA